MPETDQGDAHIDQELLEHACFIYIGFSVEPRIPELVIGEKVTFAVAIAAKVLSEAVFDVGEEHKGEVKNDWVN